MARAACYLDSVRCILAILIFPFYNVRLRSSFIRGDFRWWQRSIFALSSMLARKGVGCLLGHDGLGADAFNEGESEARGGE